MLTGTAGDLGRSFLGLFLPVHLFTYHFFESWKVWRAQVCLFPASPALLASWVAVLTYGHLKVRVRLAPAAGSSQFRCQSHFLETLRAAEDGGFSRDAVSENHGARSSSSPSLVCKFPQNRWVFSPNHCSHWGPGCSTLKPTRGNPFFKHLPSVRHPAVCLVLPSLQIPCKHCVFTSLHQLEPLKVPMAGCFDVRNDNLTWFNPVAPLAPATTSSCPKNACNNCTLTHSAFVRYKM